MAGEVAGEATEQAAKIVETAAEEIIGGSGSSGSDPSQSADSRFLARAGDPNAGEEISRLRHQIGEIGANGPKRDLEKEIGAVREEKEEKEKKRKEEEELLRKIAQEREEEQRAAQTDALLATGSKPKRGSAFARDKTKGTGEKLSKKF